MAIKFNELKKKIQSTILLGGKPVVSNDKKWKWFIFNNVRLSNEWLNKNIKYYLE